MTNIEKFKSYLNYYQNKDIQSISEMLSDGVHLRDWKISVTGKSSAVFETKKNFDNAQSIEIAVLNCMENASSVSGELEITVDGSETIYVVDVVTFNHEGLISSIKAYIGRQD